MRAVLRAGIVTHMSTIKPDNRISTYAPTSPTTTFSIGFDLYNREDVAVYHNGGRRYDFTVLADFTAGKSSNGRVVFSSGITGAVSVLGYRIPRRQSRFQDGAPLPTRDQNLALDVLTAQMQEMHRDISRALLNSLEGSQLSIEELIDTVEIVANLRSAAFRDASSFATSAQGARADTALQPGASLAPVKPQSFSLAVGEDTVTISGGYGEGGIFEVILNGSVMEEGSDWTATDGVHVSLTSPITAFDAISTTNTARLLVRVAQVYGTASETLDGGFY